jgi:steroid delta-isomerase-like uncharacterized protein
MRSLIPLLSRISLVFAIILLCIAHSCKQPVPEGLSEEEANAIIEKILKVYNEGDLTLVDETIAAEYRLHHSAYPEDIVGIEAFKKYITDIRTAFPDLNLKFDETIVKGFKIVIRWSLTGTNTGNFGDLPATGKQVSYSGLSISHLVDGKFTEAWIIYNGLDLYQQLGFKVVPPEQETEVESSEQKMEERQSM